MIPESEPHPSTGQLIGLPIDTTPAQRPGPVTIEGRYGRIEKHATRHTAELCAAFAGHDRIWTYMSHGPFTDEPSLAAFFDRRAVSSDPYAYAVIDASGRTVGSLSLSVIRPEMRVVEVGHVLYAPTLQRTPLGTEAQYLLARYAFETLGYRRYEWKCNSLNEPSRRAALRYGFTYEATFRQHQIIKDRNRDTAWFSMLASEWPARKAAFERWLDPGNFDAYGKQRHKLGDA